MKGNLLQGTARGRMGEIVASVRHGKQVSIHNLFSLVQETTRA